MTILEKPSETKKEGKLMHFPGICLMKYYKNTKLFLVLFSGLKNKRQIFFWQFAWCNEKRGRSESQNPWSHWATNYHGGVCILKSKCIPPKIESFVFQFFWWKCKLWLHHNFIKIITSFLVRCHKPETEFLANKTWKQPWRLKIMKLLVPPN